MFVYEISCKKKYRPTFSRPKAEATANMYAEKNAVQLK